ncbi:MAG: glycosyltransferase [Chthoniobacterales bacterium]
MITRPTRVDLHIYSRYSDRAGDWVLRRLDFPASATSPQAVYDRLKKAGMGYYTITDHNTIEGCLQIAHLPGAFISEEVTTYFPEDGCKVFLLIWNITERQHEEIRAARHNIYDLQDYLAQEDIAHAVAHPLFSVNHKLQPIHLKKLALLFRHFEGVNGLRHRILSDTLRFTLERLTPAHIARFSEETGITPTHDEPWRKVFTAGSDDHGGIYGGNAYTETPRAATLAEYFENLKQGRCTPNGESGTSLSLAHSIYSVAFQFAKEKVGKTNPAATDFLEKIFSRFMEGKDPTEFSLTEKLGFLAQGIATGKIFEMAKVGNSSIWKELSSYFSQPQMHAAIAKVTEGVEEPERRAFLMANLISSQLTYRLFTHFLTQARAGKFLESIQLISPLVPIVALLSPYILAFRMPKRDWLRRMAVEVCDETPGFLGNQKRAWFTDTLEDVNGVSTTIRRMTAAGIKSGHDLTVVTCRSEVAISDIPIKNFMPIGEFELPEYELQRLSFPPILQIIDYIQQEGFTELIISTPGPMGLVALLAANVLGLRTLGIYHTDFPQYVRILTDDSLMETLTWNYMHWFYSQLDMIYVNSEDYRVCWEERGIASDKLKLFPRGLDIELFHPSRRCSNFWKDRGLKEGETGVLYVGRISREKNLDVFVAAMKKIIAKNLPVRALFVGDGPYLKKMKELFPEGIYTGGLSGIDLATAYASADFFVFPSATDTFGNVVIEAQAAGIPVIVTNIGGPRDLVREGEDGFITRAADVNGLVKAIEALHGDTEMRQRFGKAARKKVETRDWISAFEKFWAASPQ